MIRLYFRCLSAEILKSKRTLYLAACTLLPLLLAVFNLLLHLGIRPTNYGSDPGDAWLSFFHNTFSLGALLLFPSVSILSSTFIAHQEHDHHHWRKLLCLPVPRGVVYLSKLTITLGLGLLACLVMFCADLVLGVLYAQMSPASGLQIASIPVARMLALFLIIFVLGLLMTTIQLEISLRVKNFVISIGVGLALLLAGMYFAEVDVLCYLYPWSLQALIYKSDQIWMVIVGAAISLGGTLLLANLRLYKFAHEDVLE